MHAVALALFALVIGGGAGPAAGPLVGVGFVLVAASYVVALRRPKPVVAPAPTLAQVRVSRERPVGIRVPV